VTQEIAQSEFCSTHVQYLRLPQFSPVPAVHERRRQQHLTVGGNQLRLLLLLLAENLPEKW